MFSVMKLKFKQRGLSKEKSVQKVQMDANSVDPDQSAPLGAV